MSELINVGLHRRLDQLGNPPSNYFAIVDEFQNFLTPDIGEKLTELPKYGLKFMLFHQFIQQLQGEDPLVFQAVLSACQTKIVFGGLASEDATRLVEELFTGQINHDRIQFLVKQLLIWPELGREKIYGEGESTTKAHGTMFGSASGSMGGSASGLNWNPGEVAWSSPGHTMSDFKSSSMSDFGGDSDSEAHGTNTFEVDIPFIFPRVEVQNVPMYTKLEQTKEQLAGLLMHQAQRHYLIKRPGQPTVIGVVPKVNKAYPSPYGLPYLDSLKQRFLPAAQVDHLLKGVSTKLLRAAGVALPSNAYDEAQWQELDGAESSALSSE